ncbi:MAG: DUF2283 domain-containing protein [Patescibacteria group bacterium]
MKITIDKEANAAYIYLLPKNGKYYPLTTITADENVNIDYTKDNQLFGIEILDLDLLDMNHIKDAQKES